MYRLFPITEALDLLADHESVCNICTEPLEIQELNDEDSGDEDESIRQCLDYFTANHLRAPAELRQQKLLTPSLKAMKKLVLQQ